MKIIPVVLSGGYGSRLWPVSRQSMPKQFAHFLGPESLFQQALKRCSDVIFETPLVVTSESYRFIVSEQIANIGANAEVLLEPNVRNTAPAIIASCLLAEELSEHDLMLIMPSDHYISDKDMFTSVIQKAAKTAQKGKLVTFGIKPYQAETGFGYIECSASIADGYKLVKSFIEKPHLDLAKQMIKSDDFLWNSGIFLFSRKLMLSIARKFEPQMLGLVSDSFEMREKKFGYTRLGKVAWANVTNISFDKAFLEKEKDIACFKLEAGWTDVGNWAELLKISKHGAEESEFNKNAITVDCKNCEIKSFSDNVAIAALGVNNIIAVTTEDAVLIMEKNRVQDVRVIVDKLKALSLPQAAKHRKDFRPWGWFESLTYTQNYQVKRLHVSPGSSLSLQTHKFRFEHWVVVEGIATVQRDDKIIELRANESTFIEAGQKHRLSNKTLKPLTVIEVQTGSYLGEDDIIRHEDIYERIE